MLLTKTLISKEDSSVNFIFDKEVEARFVQRQPDYFIVYLSSQNGCNKACRFCHLTQTKQTQFDPVDPEGFLTQAKTVLEYYRNLKEKKANVVHFNFMARGEPFANQYLLKNCNQILDSLEKQASEFGLKAKFLFSSILPLELQLISLIDVFKECRQDILVYYSMYSVEEEFRRKWLPKALPVETALAQLKQLSDLPSVKLGVHGAFIEGENDSEEQVNKMIDALKRHELEFRFNLVRYNPYSSDQGRESLELEAILEKMKTIAQQSSRIVPRVGFDVKASCGMFVDLKSSP